MNHPAILKSQELNDSESDELLPHENALIATINKATWHRTNSYVAAKMLWGDLPRMYRAHLIAADEHFLKTITAALQTYQAALETV